MKRLLITLAAVGALVSPALADFYLAGDFNGWTSTGTLLTQTSPGIWQATVTGLANNSYHEFKITDGSWDNTEFPRPYGGPNSWLYADGSGNVTVTYDVNAYSDGWLNANNRIGISTDPGTWTAIGDWQHEVASGDWLNNASQTAMTAVGGGVYQLQEALTPGTYQYRAVLTGTWTGIGTDARDTDAYNLSFSVTADDPNVTFSVNALNGTIKLDMAPVPEPSTIALLGFALAGLFCFRRRQ
jgi:hypothetical protein